MALISNGLRLAAFPHLGGASVYTANRDSFFSPGLRKTFAYGQGKVTDVTNRASVPDGYRHPYALDLAQKSGGLVSRSRINGTGDVAAANLAGGLGADADLAGSGDITNAAGTMLIAAAATLTGSGVLAADIIGLVNLFAALTGSTALTANLAGAAGIDADLAGSGDITNAALASILSAAANLTGSGSISNAAMAAGVQAVANLVGSGTLSADIVGIFNMASNCTGSGDLAAAMTALAHAVSALTGNGTLTAGIAAKGTLSSDIKVTGDLLSTANVAQAVWDAVATSNLTYSEVMKVLAAVSAGKTQITNLGGGNATVVFRDVGDTKDVLTADMVGSERVNVDIDPE